MGRGICPFDTILPVCTRPTPPEATTEGQDTTQDPGDVGGGTVETFANQVSNLKLFRWDHVLRCGNPDESLYSLDNELTSMWITWCQFEVISMGPRAKVHQSRWVIVFFWNWINVNVDHLTSIWSYFDGDHVIRCDNTDESLHCFDIESTSMRTTLTSIWCYFDWYHVVRWNIPDESLIPFDIVLTSMRVTWRQFEVILIRRVFYLR